MLPQGAKLQVPRRHILLPVERAAARAAAPAAARAPGGRLCGPRPRAGCRGVGMRSHTARRRTPSLQLHFRAQLRYNLGLNSINCLNRAGSGAVRRAAHLSELRARGGRSAGLRVVRRHHLERPPGSVPWPAQQLERRARRTAHARADGAARLIAPGLPRYAVRTQRPRLVRVPRTYSTWGPGGKWPCVSGTHTVTPLLLLLHYSTEAGPGAHVSAEVEARRVGALLQPALGVVPG